MKKAFCVCAMAVLLPASASWAWLAKGHDAATRAAVRALPDSMPAFFRDGEQSIARASLTPDAMTRPIARPELHATEAPEHYFDLELVEPMLAKEKLPPIRYAFLDAIAGEHVKPSAVGLLPYAMVETHERLTVFLALHRRWPRDADIQRQCLVYAGLLAHYAQDSCQPLHTTIHYDGKAAADGTSPRTGIHVKVDALIGKAGSEPAEIAKSLVLERSDDEFRDVPGSLGWVMWNIRQSHKLADRVYELEAKLPDLDAPIEDEQVRKFAQERLTASAELTAQFYVAAWRQSASIKIPDWKDLAELYGSAGGAGASPRPDAGESQKPPGAGEQTTVREAQGGDTVIIDQGNVKGRAQWQGGNGTITVTSRPGGASITITVTGTGAAKASSESRSDSGRPAQPKEPDDQSQQ